MTTFRMDETETTCTYHERSMESNDKDEKIRGIIEVRMFCDFCYVRILINKLL